jgi:hypothetical protein
MRRDVKKHRRAGIARVNEGMMGRARRGRLALPLPSPRMNSTEFANLIVRMKEDARFYEWRERFRADLPKDDRRCLQIYSRFQSGKVREGLELLWGALK